MEILKMIAAFLFGVVFAMTVAGGMINFIDVFFLRHVPDTTPYISCEKGWKATGGSIDGNKTCHTAEGVKDCVIIYCVKI